jgi:stage V sporulation protein D (sporulation-specific penicillin-binding protein)
MDTSSGAILAMATSSPFNPNSPYALDEISQSKLDNSGYVVGSAEYSNYKRELLEIAWSNKAISETYEPGSTFKIITVAAALESGAADMSDTFSCHGYHEVGGWRIKCHKVSGHGNGFSLAYGLQMSCNPTMMKIAEKTGADTMPC